MNEPTVLFYGTAGHPVLEPLYQAARQRGRRRVVFIVQEDFPLELGVSLGAGRDDPSGVLLPRFEVPISLDDVCGVCLDSYFIDPSRLNELDETDLRYVQNESWATLIALFARLNRRPDCVVANHVTRREYVSSRAARLAFMARCGMRVPHTLVTSEPSAARAFYARHGARTLYKPVSHPLPQFKRFGDADLERIEAIRRAPVHFEEELEGDIVQCAVIGAITVTLQGHLPADQRQQCVDMCRQLDLKLAEVTLRSTANGYVATGLWTHLSPMSLQFPAVVEATLSMLEGTN